MRRGRPPKPTHVLLMQGTYRADRHGKRADAPRVDQPHTKLTEAQQTLLAAVPHDLQGEARAVYERGVRTAPWLQLVERDGLVSYAQAVAAQRQAGQRLEECLRDPTSADPKSTAGRAAALYDRIVARQAAVIMQWSKQLGFNERDRPIPAPEREADPDDPWALLRLLPSARRANDVVPSRN